MSDDLVIDLTNYKNKFGDRVIPGDYTVIIEDVEKDTSSKGNPMINMWLRVVGGDFDGSTIVDRLTDTENSKFRIVMFMQALGLPTPRARVRLNTRSLIGKRLVVNVDDGEPYMNRVKSEVRGYMQAEGGSSEPVTDLDDVAEPAAAAAVVAGGLGEFAPEPTSNGATAAQPRQPQAAPAAEMIEVDEIDLDQIEL